MIDLVPVFHSLFLASLLGKSEMPAVAGSDITERDSFQDWFYYTWNFVGTQLNFHEYVINFSVKVTVHTGC